MVSLRIVVAAGLVLALAGVASAAERPSPVSALKGTGQAEVAYDDPLGRSTPQGTVVGFLKAMQRQDYERAVEFLDTKQTGKRARELAIELEYILTEGISAATGKLSARPEGNLQDDLPPNREEIGVVRTNKGEYRIRLDRVQKESNPPVWLFASETLKFVPRIYEEIDVPWIERQLPAALTETRLAGLPLYRWVFAVLMLPLAFVIGWLVTALLMALTHRALRERFGETVLAKAARAKNPMRLIVAAAVIYIYSRGVFSLLGQMFWVFAASTMAVAGLMWLAIHLIDVVLEVIERRRPEAANAVVRLAATLLKTLAVVIGLVVIFYYFAGINLTAVVAGLGVGGIAVAFAAQKTIENFFGGVFLVWDKPIRLGDYCKAGEHQGHVEHIGLRSTQIRTPTRTVVSIPNGQLSAVSIENFTLRDRFLFRHTLNLRYETTTDQLRFILAGIRELLYRHPGVDSRTARIRFVAFGPSSLDLEIFAYVLETAQEAFLAVQEDLLLRIMDLVEAGGSGFAFPSQTLYMAKDEGLDAEKGRKAADAVRQWKEEDNLPFPDHRQARISQLEGTLDYPPEGSVMKEKDAGRKA